MEREQFHKTLIATIFIAASLSFIGKPIHIDGWSFLYLARTLESWADPYRSFEYFLGNTVEIFKDFPHPPLFVYFVKLMSALPASIIVTKLLLTIAATIGILSFYDLSRIFVRHPLFTTFYFAFGLSFFLSSTNLMPDVLMVSFGLVALERLIIRKDYTLSAFLISLSCMTKYSGVIFAIAYFGYIAFDIVLKPEVNDVAATDKGTRDSRPAAIAKVCRSLVIFSILPLIWVWSNLHYHGEVHAFARHYLTSASVFGLKLTGVMAALGIAALPVVTVYGGLRNSLHPIKNILFGLIVAGLIIFKLVPEEKVGNGINFVLPLVAIASTLSALVVIGYDLSRSGVDRRSGFLIFFFFEALVITVLFSPFAASRYAIPVAIPLLWLFSGSFHRVFSPSRDLEIRSIVVTIIVTLSVATGDYIWARGYERLIPRIVKEHPNVKYFNGEWGFRHYAEKAGLTYLSEQGLAGLMPGDGVITSEASVPHALKDKEIIVRRSFYEFGENWPLKSMSRESHAGFYSDLFGIAPFGFDIFPVDTILVDTIKGGFVEVYDLMKMSKNAVIVHGAAANIRFGLPFTVAGQTSPAIYMHPDARIKFTLDNAAGLRLKGYAAMADAVAGKSKGVSFKIYIDGKLSTEIAYDPMKESGRKLFSLVIPANGDNQTVIELETTPRVPGDYRYCWAGWQGIKIVRDIGQTAQGR